MSMETIIFAVVLIVSIWYLMRTHAKYKTYKSLVNYNDEEYMYEDENYKNQLNYDFYRRFWLTLVLTSITGIFFGSFRASQVFFGSLFLNLLTMPKIPRKKEEEHIAGTKIVSAQSLSKKLEKENEEHRLEIGGVIIPKNIETRSFLFVGSPGTGKSQAITSALDVFRKYGERAIIADVSGIYTSRYYDESKDIILNPFDKRSVSWSPLAEISSTVEIKALARSFIPDAEGSSSEWQKYAQTAFSVILEYCYKNDLTNGDIYHISNVADLESLRVIFKDTPAYPYVCEGNERMFGSIRSILATYVYPFQYLDKKAGKNAFSIKRYVQNDNKKGWIFLSYLPSHRDVQKSLIGGALDIAARALLDAKVNLNNRFIFSIDELPLIGKIETLSEILSNGRKYGAVVLAGMQTISQVRETYGRENAQTILANIGTWLVLRSSDYETAEYFSKYLGEAKVMRESYGESYRQNVFGFKDDVSQSINKQQTIDKVVLPSEIQGLKDLTGYIRVAGHDEIAKIKLSIVPDIKVAENIILSDVIVDNSKKQDESLEEIG